MSQYMNVVRMTVKDGSYDKWQAQAERDMETFKRLPGLIEASYCQTGDRSVCVVGRWESEEALANARPEMIAILDKTRGILEPLPGDLGVTDPVSGPVILHVER